jgi:hypothetical protein
MVLSFISKVMACVPAYWPEPEQKKLWGSAKFVEFAQTTEFFIYRCLVVFLNIVDSVFSAFVGILNTTFLVTLELELSSKVTW